MTRSKVEFQGTYQEAVAFAQESWRMTRRATSVHSGTDTTYWYHDIAGNGQERDRNFNSGVPETGNLSG